MTKTIIARGIMSAKAEQDAVREEIDRVCDGVDIIHRPSVHQYLSWRAFADFQSGCDPDGYFLGRCPFSKGDDHPARFNFSKGVMRCDDGCMPKPTASLTNAMMMLAARVV